MTLKLLGFASVLCLLWSCGAQDPPQMCPSAPCDLQCEATGGKECTQMCQAGNTTSPCSMRCSGENHCMQMCMANCDPWHCTGKNCTQICQNKACAGMWCDHDSGSCSQSIMDPMRKDQSSAECKSDSCNQNCMSGRCQLRCLEGSECVQVGTANNTMLCTSKKCSQICFGGGKCSSECRDGDFCHQVATSEMDDPSQGQGSPSQDQRGHPPPPPSGPYNGPAPPPGSTQGSSGPIPPGDMGGMSGPGGGMSGPVDGMSGPSGMTGPGGMGGMGPGMPDMAAGPSESTGKCQSKDCVQQCGLGECTFECQGERCIQNATAKADKLVGTCSADECDQKCDNITSCSLTCTGKTCNLACSHTDSDGPCKLACGDSVEDCTMNCEGYSSCDMNCGKAKRCSSNGKISAYSGARSLSVVSMATSILPVFAIAYIRG